MNTLRGRYKQIFEQVRRLQAAVPDLSEADCLELLAQIAPFVEVNRPKNG